MKLNEFHRHLEGYLGPIGDLNQKIWKQEYLLTNFRTKLLSLKKFPTGIQFHHNPGYMAGLKRGVEQPYNFHMCWTQTKGDKLINFKSINMWYLQPQCSQRDLKTIGRTLGKFSRSFSMQYNANMKGGNRTRNWREQIHRMCCMQPDSESLWTIPSNRMKGPSFITVW